MGDDRDRKGIGGDLRGVAGAVCKIAGIAYGGPPNLALAPISVRVDLSNAVDVRAVTASATW
jgi:hypothetical protein